MAQYNQMCGLQGAHCCTQALMVCDLFKGADRSRYGVIKKFSRCGRIQRNIEIDEFQGFSHLLGIFVHLVHYLSDGVTAFLSLCS